MVDAGIDNFFSTGSYLESGLNTFDMEGIFDEGADVHNLPYTLSPELIDSYFTEIF